VQEMIVNLLSIENLAGTRDYFWTYRPDSYSLKVYKIGLLRRICGRGKRSEGCGLVEPGHWIAPEPVAPQAWLHRVHSPDGDAENHVRNRRPKPPDRAGGVPSNLSACLSLLCSLSPDPFPPISAEHWFHQLLSSGIY
jgi:hypothetical protein